MGKTLYLVIFYFIAVSCSTAKHSHCFISKALKAEQFAFEYNNRMLYPQKTEALITTGKDCIGLHQLYYKMGSGHLIVPTLKLGSIYYIFSENGNSNLEKINHFKELHGDLFDFSKLDSIQERFLKGKVFVGEL